VKIGKLDDGLKSLEEAKERGDFSSTTVEFTDMRAISLGSVLDCSGMASERSGCF